MWQEEYETRKDEMKTMRSKKEEIKACFLVKLLRENSVNVASIQAKILEQFVESMMYKGEEYKLIPWSFQPLKA